LAGHADLARLRLDLARQLEGRRALYRVALDSAEGEVGGCPAFGCAARVVDDAIIDGTEARTVVFDPAGLGEDEEFEAGQTLLVEAELEVHCLFLLRLRRADGGGRHPLPRLRGVPAQQPRGLSEL